MLILFFSSYGFLCINKNQPRVGEDLCSNYKTRFCCAKTKYSEWTQWSKWSSCSEKCDGGTKTRTRKCDKAGAKNDCYGNWEPLKEKYSKQTADCNVLPCAEDRRIAKWSEWSKCPLTCGKGGERHRYRGCKDGAHGGKKCPDRRKEMDFYRESKDCNNPDCMGNLRYE